MSVSFVYAVVRGCVALKWCIAHGSDGSGLRAAMFIKRKSVCIGFACTCVTCPRCSRSLVPSWLFARQRGREHFTHCLRASSRGRSGANVDLRFRASKHLLPGTILGCCGVPVSLRIIVCLLGPASQVAERVFFLFSLGAVELDPLSVVVGEASASWAVCPVRTSSVLR